MNFNQKSSKLYRIYNIILSFIIVTWLISCNKEDKTIGIKERPIVNVTATAENAKIHFIFSGVVMNGTIYNTFDRIDASSKGFNATLANGSQFNIEVQLELSNAKPHEPTKDKNGKDVQGFFTREDIKKPITLTLVSKNENGFNTYDTESRKERVTRINLETDTLTTNKVLKTMSGFNMTQMVQGAIESTNIQRDYHGFVGAKFENLSVLKRN